MLRHFFGELLVGQWNIEGLTDSKVVHLQLIVERLGIGILCMQETHRRNSDYYGTAEGVLDYFVWMDS